jgi:hypothetical protein
MAFGPSDSWRAVRAGFGWLKYPYTGTGLDDHAERLQRNEAVGHDNVV